ncbi:MAG: hypothetical protein K2Z76_00545 [Mycobacterium gordonae]|nr:hypothetical protein [Mycobacterium gordonae]
MQHCRPPVPDGADHVAKRVAGKLAAGNYQFNANEAFVATGWAEYLKRNLPYFSDNKEVLGAEHNNLLTSIGIDVDDPATWPQNIAYCDHLFDHTCTAASELHIMLAPEGFYQDVYGVDHGDFRTDEGRRQRAPG